MSEYELLETAGRPVKMWTRGVPVDPATRRQLARAAELPFLHKWVAAMPDVHLGKGATVGSVIPTVGAIVPAAVGVDIGCGMMAVRTSLGAAELPDDLHPLRVAIEGAVPHGRSNHGKRGDRGAWRDPPHRVREAFAPLEKGYRRVLSMHRSLERNAHPREHLGTLGTGNHFLEVCLDEADRVWVMLHSGSRGIGNRIGMHFITLAQREARRQGTTLPDRDLAWLDEGSRHFENYLVAVGWAQDYARQNREVMMDSALAAMASSGLLPDFASRLEAINCHHNYVNRERHYGRDDVLVTRKGAISARVGELGIIPGSMGARSFLVRGKGEPQSFHSCSHGAGRVMSRTEAKRRFTLEDHARATAHVECRKDAAVLDETPAAYKDIDAVMAAQAELVEVVHTLRQVLCVKG